VFPTRQLKDRRVFPARQLKDRRVFPARQLKDWWVFPAQQLKRPTNVPNSTIKRPTSVPSSANRRPVGTPSLAIKRPTSAPNLTNKRPTYAISSAKECVIFIFSLPTYLRRTDALSSTKEDCDPFGLVKSRLNPTYCVSLDEGNRTWSGLTNLERDGWASRATSEYNLHIYH